MDSSEEEQALSILKHLGEEELLLSDETFRTFMQQWLEEQITKMQLPAHGLRSDVHAHYSSSVTALRQFELMSGRRNY